MMHTEREIRSHIVEIGRRVYENGYVAASDGNISARLNDGTIVTTPTMICKGRMTESDLVLVDLDGTKLRKEERNPSSEFAMHREIYRLRPEIHAVVHAHPPFGTGFAVANVPLDKPLLSEVVLTLGCVPLTSYGTPSTNELVDSLTPFIPYHDALLMANHGAVACGQDLEAAYARMETLEHFAKIALIARIVGQPKELPAEAVAKLLDVREKAGYMSPDARGGQLCGFAPNDAPGGPANGFTSVSVNSPGPCSCGAVNARGEETVTLTKKELNALIIEAARLIARQMS
jgi:L-fuculose-phosphate aldolase